MSFQRRNTRLFSLGFSYILALVICTSASGFDVLSYYTTTSRTFQIDGVNEQIQLSTLNPALQDTQEYTIAVWLQAANWGANSYLKASEYGLLYRVFNELTDTYNGRLPALLINVGTWKTNLMATVGTSTNAYGNVSDLSYDSTQYYATGSWTFVFISISTIAQEYNFEISLAASATSLKKYTRVISDPNLYYLASNASVIFGDDSLTSVMHPCNCSIYKWRMLAGVYITDPHQKLALQNDIDSAIIQVFRDISNGDYFAQGNQYSIDGTSTAYSAQLSGETNTTYTGPAGSIGCNIQPISWTLGLADWRSFVVSFDFMPLEASNQALLNFRVNPKGDIMSIVYNATNNTIMLNAVKKTGWQYMYPPGTVSNEQFNHVVVAVVADRQLNNTNISFYASVNHSPLQALGQLYTTTSNANYWSKNIIVDLCAWLDGTSLKVNMNWAAPFHIANLLEVTGVGSIFDSSDDLTTNCQTTAVTTALTTICLDCKEGYYLSGVECVDSCPAGSVAEPSTRSCSSCPSDYVLWESNGFCYPACPTDAPYFIDTNTKQCTQCPANCLSCLDASTCTSCNGTLELIDGECVVVCNSGYYSDSSSLSCMECPSTCATCKNASYCTSCEPSNVFYPADNTCLTECPTGYYNNDSTCESCPVNCVSCTSADNCDSCTESTVLIDGSCVSPPPDDPPPQSTDPPTEDPPSNPPNNPTPNVTSNNSNPQPQPSSIVIEPFTLTVAKTSSSVASTAMQVQAGATSILPLIARAGSTTAVLLIGFVGDILLFRFINVPFPGNFKEFCTLLYVNFLPNIYNTFETEYEIPSAASGKFKEFGMSAVLLGNSGNTLDREFIALTLIALTSVLVVVLPKKCSSLNKLFKSVRDSIMWNLFLTFYIGDCSELVLFSIIQLREETPSGWYPKYASVICIAILASYPILFAYFIYLLNRKAPAKVGIEPEKDVIEYQVTEQQLNNQEEPRGQKEAKKWAEIPARVNMVAEGFRTNHWYNRNFLLVMTFESIIVDFLLIYFQDFGFAQAIAYTALTLVFWILTVVVYRPFASKLQTTIFAVNNAVKAILGGLAIWLGMQDETAALDHEDTIGLAFIAIIMTAIGFNGLIAIGETLLGLVQLCKRLRAKQKVVPQVVSEVSPMASEKKLSRLKISSITTLATKSPGSLVLDEMTSPQGTIFSPPSSFPDLEAHLQPNPVVRLVFDTSSIQKANSRSQISQNLQEPSIANSSRHWLDQDSRPRRASIPMKEPSSLSDIQEIQPSHFVRRMKERKTLGIKSSRTGTQIQNENLVDNELQILKSVHLSSRMADQKRISVQAFNF